MTVKNKILTWHYSRCQWVDNCPLQSAKLRWQNSDLNKFSLLETTALNSSHTWQSLKTRITTEIVQVSFRPLSCGSLEMNLSTVSTSPINLFSMHMLKYLFPTSDTKYFPLNLHTFYTRGLVSYRYLAWFADTGTLVLLPPSAIKVSLKNTGKENHYQTTTKQTKKWTMCIFHGTVKPLIQVAPEQAKNCWSLRCSWGIVCRRCSNYIFILDLTPGFNGLGQNNCKTRAEIFKFLDLVRIRGLTVSTVFFITAL